MIPPKETKNTLMTYPKEEEIYKLSDKEFGILKRNSYRNYLLQEHTDR